MIPNAGFFGLAIAIVTGPGAGHIGRTASQALAIAERLCVVPNDATFVGWEINPRDREWAVTGRYYPKLPPSEMSVIDVHVYVPLEGPPPNRCSGVSN